MSEVFVPAGAVNIELHAEVSDIGAIGNVRQNSLPFREASTMDSSFSKRANSQSRTGQAFSPTTKENSSSHTGPYSAAVALPRRRFRGLAGRMELSARDLIKPNLRMFQQFLQFLNRAASEATKESPSDGSSGSKRGASSASLGSG